MSALWFVPLAVTAAGAVVAAAWARLLGRDVAKLQASLRPLRSPRPQRGRRPDSGGRSL